MNKNRRWDDLSAGRIIFRLLLAAAALLIIVAVAP